MKRSVRSIDGRRCRVKDKAKYLYQRVNKNMLRTHKKIGFFPQKIQFVSCHCPISKKNALNRIIRRYRLIRINFWITISYTYHEASEWVREGKVITSGTLPLENHNFLSLSKRRHKCALGAKFRPCPRLRVSHEFFTRQDIRLPTLSTKAYSIDTLHVGWFTDQQRVEPKLKNVFCF